MLATYHVSTDEATRDVSGSLPLDVRFPVASVTKMLVALLAARLCEDGILAWDEPLPATDELPGPISLRALLCHAAGVPFELDPAHWGPKKSLTQSELTSALMRPPRLPLPPGTWHYSNLGYGMAARVLENAARQPCSILLAERLLLPLGMTMTSFPDEATEGRAVLGAAAAAGDLWSTLDDLMTLARAIDGHRPDVVTWPMLALLLEAAIPDNDGAHLGAGIRTHAVRHHRVLVSSGTIRNLTACVTVWPRRGASVLVAEAGIHHEQLWQAAARQWQRDDTLGRTWWWDGQAVIELRHEDMIDLVLGETTWPFPLFSGRADGQTLVGVDWRGEPLELRKRGEALVGNGIRLAAEVEHSAYAPAVQP
jgi:CubicO group peptidase (beta-lactamase class C family)